MYIPPFVAGVIFTVVLEVMLLIGWALVHTNRKNKKHQRWYNDDGK